MAISKRAKEILEKKATATGKELEEIEALEKEYNKRKKATSKKIKAAWKEKKKSLPKPALPTFSNEDVIAALKSSSGLISFAAEKLQVPVDYLKNQIKKSKTLRDSLFEVRETNIDIVENEVMQRILEKKDSILMMFYLKNMGAHRGWNNERMKAGSSSDKPIYIKIQPVGFIPEKGKKLPEVKISPKVEALDDPDIIDVQEI